MGSNRVTNAADPTDAQDVVTRNFLESGGWEADTIYVDNVLEKTVDHGVNIDGVLMRDSNVEMGEDKWIGLSASTARVQFEGSSVIDFDDTNTVRQNGNGALDIGFTVTNENTGAFAAANINVITRGSGDATIHFIEDEANWTLGLDNSDEDKFKINTSSLLDVSAFELDYLGNVAITGDLSITDGAYVGIEGNERFVFDAAGDNIEVTGAALYMGTNAIGNNSSVLTFAPTASGGHATFTGDVTADDLWLGGGSGSVGIAADGYLLFNGGGSIVVTDANLLLGSNGIGNSDSVLTFAAGASGAATFGGDIYIGTNGIGNESAVMTFGTVLEGSNAFVAGGLKCNAGALVADRSINGASTILLQTNNTSTGSSAANILEMTTAGGGDVFVRMLVPSSVYWSIGVDSSDSDIFKINNANTIADPSLFELDTSGNLALAGNISLISDSLAITFGAGTDMDLYYNGTDGYLRTDLTAASDLKIDCGADKTLELQETVWEDIQFHMSTGALRGVNQPSWSTFTTNTKAYQFDVDDIVDLEAQELNHKWKEGTTGHFHIHVALDAASAAATRYAKFEIYVAYPAAATGVYGETTLTAELTIPASSASLKEFYLDMGDITFTNRLIGTQVVVTFKRIAATTGTDYADEIFVTQCGCHIEQNTMGSRQEAAK
jgi:hypothetical protein